MEIKRSARACAAATFWNSVEVHSHKNRRCQPPFSVSIRQIFSAFATLILAGLVIVLGPSEARAASYGPFALTAGKSVTDGKLTLAMQADSNLVIYLSGVGAVWSTGTAGSRNCNSGCVAQFQSDGNLVLYQNSSPYWASGTGGNAGAILNLQGAWPFITITSGSRMMWNGPSGLIPDMTPPRRMGQNPNFVITPGKGPSHFPAKADVLSQHLVFAEIHPWEGTTQTDGFWSRWNETGHNPGIFDVVSLYWPKYGPYSMNNCGYIKHIGDDLKAAGVDVAAIDWLNFYPGEEGRVEAILQCINMPVVVMVDAEPAWTKSTWNDIINRLNIAVAWYARRTDLFPNYDRDPKTGSPLVIVWDPGSVGTAAQWASQIRWYKANIPEHPIFVAGLTNATGIPNFTKTALFDGYLAENGAAAQSQQIKNLNWVLSELGTAGRGEFLISNSIPTFEAAASCAGNYPVLARTMASFDQSWGGTIKAVWSGHKVQSAYVSYHNDGEDIGIEPVSYYSPLRGAGYASCNGKLGPGYLNYGSLSGTDYLVRNRYWVGQFKSTR